MDDLTDRLPFPAMAAARTPAWAVFATAVGVGVALAMLPLAYGYGKATHFLEPDQHVFVFATLLGLARLSWQVARTGTIRFYISSVQTWGLALVVGTTALHALAGVTDAPRAVLLLVLGLLWPSVIAVAARGRARPWLVGALVAGALVQSVTAGYQFLASGGARSLAATGTFVNAGSLGNYLAAALPWLLGVTAGARRAAATAGKRWAWVQYHGYCAAAALVALVLALTSARAAWLGASVGVGLVLGHMHRVQLGRWARTGWKRRLGLGLLGAGGGAALWAMLRFKEASVHGRWQIYTIGTKLFAQHPLVGIGWGRASSLFNEAQADYFATHAVPVAQQLLAADTYELFNSLLHLGVEAGAAGVLAWAAGARFLRDIARRSYREPWQLEAVGATGALLSLGISSLFSYPFQVLPIVGLAGAMLAFLPVMRPWRAALNWLGRVASSGTLALLILGLGYREGQRWQATRRWQRAAFLARHNAFAQAQPLYAQAGTVLANHGPFLYNYGVEAGLAGQNRRSIGLLEAARPHYTSSALYSYLGQAYETNGQVQRAAWCYQRASFMVPSFFYPRYRLFELYRTTGQQQEARRVGQQILAYPVKISTDLTWQIKYWVRQALLN